MKARPRKPLWGGDEQLACRKTWSETRNSENDPTARPKTHPRGPQEDHEGHQQPPHSKGDNPEPDTWQRLQDDPSQQRSNGTAPKKINVYSDGSVKNPHVAYWRTGGVGVHWPERSLEEIPVATTEK